MTDLLSRIAPRCQPLEREEEHLEEKAESHPVLSLAGALAISGFGLVGAVSAATAAVTVPLCALLGLF